MSITLKPDIKAKLIQFKNKNNCKSFNDAIKLLLNKKQGCLFVNPNISKIFLEFCDIEECKTHNEGMKKLLERYHLYGLPKINSEELLTSYFKGYDKSVEEIEVKNCIKLVNENINQIIKSISQEDIDVYKSIQAQFKLNEGNIKDHTIFRYLYKKILF